MQLQCQVPRSDRRRRGRCLGLIRPAFGNKPLTNIYLHPNLRLHQASHRRRRSLLYSKIPPPASSKSGNVSDPLFLFLAKSQHGFGDSSLCLPLYSPYGLTNWHCGLLTRSFVTLALQNNNDKISCLKNARGQYNRNCAHHH